MKKIIIVFVSLILVIHVQSQIQFGGEPLSFSSNVSSQVPSNEIQNKLSYDESDYLRCLDEVFPLGLDEKGDTLHGNYDCIKKSNMSEKVSIDFVKEAVWDTTINGEVIGRLVLNMKDAYGVAAHFSEFELGKQTYMYLYSKDKIDVHGSFMDFNQMKSGGFYHSPIKGNTLAIEVNTTTEDLDKIHLKIDRLDAFYEHYYTEQINIAKDRPRFDCQNNVNCPEWDFMCNEIRATVQLNFRRTNGPGSNCSGVLIINSCYDFEPLILTAHHCFIGEDINWEECIVRFNFQNPTCEDEDMGYRRMEAMGLELVDASGFTSLSGGGHDLALLRMTNPPPAQYNVYYAGWNVETKKKNIQGNDAVVGIHHPRSTEKSISQGKLVSRVFNPLDWGTPSIWTTEWSDGATQSGSSGSPLFDGQKFVIGALSGGVSLCPIPAQSIPILSDSWHGKLGKWDAGINVLDPCNRDLRAYGGADPNLYCLPLIHIYGQVVDPAIWRADKEQILVQSDVVRIGEIAMTAIENGADYIFQGEERVEVSSTNLTRIREGATIRLKTAPCIATEEQCGFNYFEKVGDVSEQDRFSMVAKEVEVALYTLYPNPTNNELTLDMDLDIDAKVTALLYDLSGKLVMQELNNEFWTAGFHQHKMDVAHLSSGLYILKFCINDNCFQEKVSIAR